MICANFGDIAKLLAHWLYTVWRSEKPVVEFQVHPEASDEAHLSYGLVPL